jgi:hypothetical protein
LLNQVKEVTYSTQLPEHIAVILKIGLRAAAAEGMYFSAAYVAVIFDAAARMKTAPCCLSWSFFSSLRNQVREVSYSLTSTQLPEYSTLL